jgi:hypothetical protein
MPSADTSLIDDIEDIVNKNSGDSRQENKRHVVPKAKRINKQTKEEPVQADSIIPGKLDSSVLITINHLLFTTNLFRDIPNSQ